MNAQQPNDRPASARDGFALAGALLALVIVGAIVTGTFYAGSEEGAIGTSVLRSDEAMYLAEAGLNNTLDGKDRSYFDNLADSAVDNLGTTIVPLPNGAALGTYTVEVRKQGPLITVISTGKPGRGFTRGKRTLAQIARTVNMTFPQDRAITSFGGVQMGGNATISGTDYVPSNWTDSNCTDRGATDAIHSKDTTPLTTSGNSYQLTGQVKTDSTIADTTFSQFGDVTWTMLKGMRDKTYAAGANVSQTAPTYSNGACKTSDLSNWGEPFNKTDPCFTYWPIIYAAGNLSIQGNGYGQGILLVEGDLQMTGGMTFYGIVIVKGRLSTQGQGGHIVGELMTYNGGTLNDDNTAVGSSVVQYSSCSIMRAATENKAARHPIPILARSWMDLTAAGASF